VIRERCDCGRKECAADIEIEVDKYGLARSKHWKRVTSDMRRQLKLFLVRKEVDGRKEWSSLR